MGSKHTQSIFVLASILFGLSGSGWAAEKLPIITDISPSRAVQGDTLTVSGLNLTDTDKLTKIRIDEKTITEVRIVNAKKLEVTLPKRDEKVEESDAGEYPRTIQVVVSEPGVMNLKESNKFKVIQLTWDTMKQFKVWFPLSVFVVGIIVISFFAERSIFKSETGELSLSKIQMAVWTFVFGLFYVLLASIWGEFLDITEGMFWLMGISATTAVGAKAIAVKNAVPASGGNPSKLLSDYDKTTKTYRLSLHRCQIAIWSLIVLSIFIINTIDKMHLAEIPGNLLVLMGISGGTYLGFNYPKTNA